MKKRSWKDINSAGRQKAVLAASLVLALAFPGIAAAAPAQTLPLGSIGASAVPTPREGNLLVPLRSAAESLGALVVWNNQEQSVRVSKGETVFSFKIGQDQVQVNGRDIRIERKTELVNGLTMVPLSLIRESLGVSSLNWDGSSVVPDKADLSSQAAVYFYNLLHGNAARLLATSSSALKAVMTEERAASLGERLRPLLGDQAGQISSRTEENAVHTSVIMRYAAKLPGLPLEVTVRFNKVGQVDDMNFSNETGPASAHQPAAYDRTELYAEREVVIGEGAFALPGTLTVPKGEGNFPAVVLVHGSGPNDRDGTFGGSKPFKDLAAGLAARGIAVLRYEKVTQEHTAKVSANAKFTLWDETGVDALKAVALLKKTAGIDASKIFIAGHSLGGYAAPLILKADQAGDIKGAIILSAPSENLNDVVAKQQQHALQLMLDTKQPAELIAQQEQAVAIGKQLAELIHNPEYSLDNLPSQFPLGNPYWWFEQRDYQPALLARDQKTPLLILQGENDWQVSLKQLKGWKETLKDRGNVEYKSYPLVNHLLSEYDGVSIGLEYDNPSNVSLKIIEDIEQWVKKQ
ncbi:alpha/beta hydrolase [Paenibacillus sp. MAHUQ-46]|uniref:Alpha/beta hydrolase n=1 Tax=Paenibacillus roseus TaxID=2798579 RepID=A0A934MNU7_9BACL|nr:stalk domain-containing protein [Paenibacillus roseus]MBJ6361391.1 alpha/beta hydrolase [Paenibacillus roseus]